MARMLETRDAQWLLEQPLPKRSWLVEDLISSGLVLLVGAPKIGKSWASLQLALAVSTGESFLGFATTQGDVLYLCLEDTFQRVQQRLFRLTDEANDRLHFAVSAEKLRCGLVEQLEAFADSRPGLRLVIVDTFQAVRVPTAESAYKADYGDLGELKRFGDERGITVMAVHHTRKMGDPSDVFNTVSGTNGITGSADETMVLAKANRYDGTATLNVTGRDVEMAEYRLRFRDCRWEFVERTSEEELEEREVPAAVLTVLDFMAGNVTGWRGTATKLMADAGVEGVRPNVLSKLLNEHSGFMAARGVRFSSERTNASRMLVLENVPPEGVRDGGSRSGGE